MKRLWIAVVLLLVMLAGSLTNAWYIQSVSERMTSQLGQAQQLAQSGQWKQAEEITRSVYQDWQDHHFYLHTVMRHSDTDQILRNFRSVLKYLEIQELDQYAAANADLITQVELLAEMERASVVNVL